MYCKKCNLEMKTDSTYHTIAYYRCIRCGTKCEIDISKDDDNIKWDFLKTLWNDNHKKIQKGD